MLTIGLLFLLLTACSNGGQFNSNTTTEKINLKNDTVMGCKTITYEIADSAYRKRSTDFFDRVTDLNSPGGNYVSIPTIINGQRKYLVTYYGVLVSYYQNYPESYTKKFIQNKLSAKDTIQFTNTFIKDNSKYFIDSIDLASIGAMSVKDILEQYFYKMSGSQKRFKYDTYSKEALIIIHYLFQANIVSYEDDESGILLINTSLRI